ncbi:MAG: hypothetical protein J4G13_09790 [Dehalococcoidia bacterium]|nr:hypothetical protein [Dehalococcoidia bacterium]
MPPLPPTRQLIPLAIAGFIVTAIVAFILVVLFISWFSNPPFGWGNAPDQPIPFPHTVHAGAVEEGGHAIQCEFCHRNVTTGAAATVPAVEVCVICHKQINGSNVTVGAREQIEDLNPDQLVNIQRVLDKHTEGRPIDWERVHRMPDHVRFVHEAHLRFLTQGEPRQVTLPVGDEKPINLPVTTAEACSVCHGDVAHMAEVQPQQGQSLKMGTCLDCHRENDVSTDCTICHK